MCMPHRNHDGGGDHGTGHRTRWYSGRIGAVLFVSFGIVGYFLWAEHGTRMIAFLPYALFLLCPLMHVFMRRGHTYQHERSSRAPGVAERAST